MIALFDSPRSRTLLLLSGLILLALALDIWQSAAQRAGAHTLFDNAVSAVSSPLQRPLLWCAGEVKGAWNAAARGRQLEEENAHLSARAASLETKLLNLEEASARSNREKALLAAYPDAGGTNRLAHVIGAGAGGWLSYLVVDRGSADGVNQKDIAVTPEGLVGQVYAVTSHTACILPITDPASGVAARLQRTRETGVVKGLGQWRCELRYLGLDSEVRTGDQVLTAGIGGIFPEGLRVGAVTAVRTDEYSPGKVAELRPAAEFRKIEEVVLLRPSR